MSNSITLKPKASAGDVKQRIVNALRRHAEFEAGRIQVQVQDDGTVRLEGDVDNWDERRAVEIAVWAAAGVRNVEDHLHIR